MEEEGEDRGRDFTRANSSSSCCIQHLRRIMHKLSTLTIPTNHYLRIWTFSLRLADELSHQFTSIGIATSQEALHGCGICDALDCEVVRPYYGREGSEEGWAGEGPHVSLFCCLLGEDLMHCL